jgi:hypothetical protein
MSISEVNWYCCKWVENRSRFKSSSHFTGQAMAGRRCHVLAGIAQLRPDFQLKRVSGSPDSISAPEARSAFQPRISQTEMDGRIKHGDGH